MIRAIIILSSDTDIEIALKVAFLNTAQNQSCSSNKIVRDMKGKISLEEVNYNFPPKVLKHPKIEN